MTVCQICARIDNFLLGKNLGVGYGNDSHERSASDSFPGGLTVQKGVLPLHEYPVVSCVVQLQMRGMLKT